MFHGIAQHFANHYSESQDMASDFDFSKIFEEEALNGPYEAFSGATMDENKATVNDNSFPQATSLAPVPQDLSPPPVSEGDGFINLYMIVDPRTGQMVCPKQTLTFKNGSTMSTAMVGPNFLCDAPNSGIIRQQVPAQQISPMTPNSFKTKTLDSISFEGLFSPSALSTGYPVVQFDTENGLQKPSSPTTTTEGTPQPLRALSAYNFFFQAERDKILNGRNSQQEDDWSDDRKQRLLQAHWSRDRTKKRRHRKSHGRISFIELSKEISSRWKKLPDERKEFYREVAALDFARFQRETKELAEAGRCPSSCPVGV